MKKGKILVVDDNAGIRATLKLLLPVHFAQVELIPSPVTLVAKMDEYRPDVVLLDMNFHADINTGNEGLYWAGELHQMYPETQIVLFTAYANIELAVEGMRRGAFDFVVKPWDNDKLLGTLCAARDKSFNVRKQQPLHASQDRGMLWGTGGKMDILRKAVKKIAPTDATVLITGENGTGKDLLAQEIHAGSRRSLSPMVCVDAGAITDTLFESELFGHVKGAFTDAHSDHIGKFESADGGTLFLDEIGNIPLHLQAKLLRAIQNRSITRVGDTKEIPVDIRLICATNMDLAAMVRDGRFREDLYYRINTVHLNLPALRERTEDIVPLGELFISRFNEKYHRSIAGFTDDAVRALESYGWSGNIRELQNCIEKAVILCEGQYISAADLQLEEKPAAASVPERPEETLDQAEERTIREAMARYEGNLTLVARSLGVSRPTLYSKLKKYSI